LYYNTPRLLVGVAWLLDDNVNRRSPRANTEVFGWLATYLLELKERELPKLVASFLDCRLEPFQFFLIFTHRSYHHRLFVLAEHGAQRVGDLADGAVGFDGGDDARHQVLA
jgi:hypothetical protein